NVKFLKRNWNAEYERRLAEAGFRGSLFILRHYKMHLEPIQQSTSVLLAAQRADVERLTSGRVAEPFDPLLGSTTRPLCRALLAFLDFEDQAAQTQLVFYSEHVGAAPRG